ncbi:MAG: hypothetical protein IH589_20835 [Anaerolineales bacterium]|nr:hypothetical protein [Anaerolineales bacterium]
MTGKDKPNTEQANLAAQPEPATDSSTSEAETGEQEATDTPPTWETKPRKGEIVADETKRFFSETVAVHGLSRAADKIASSIKDVEAGGILIVDDLQWAVNDIFYLDICKKLDVLLQWSEDVSNKCHHFEETLKEQVGRDNQLQIRQMTADEWNILLKTFTRGEETNQGILLLGDTIRFRNILGGIPSAITSAVAFTPVINEGLKAIGDIIGYFRTDYDIKGQTLANVDDLYIQALVAEKLIQKNKDVYLLNFNFISESKLVNDLGELMKRKYAMLTCVDEIKSKFVDGREAHIQALNDHLKSLKGRLIEYLVKVDDDAIQALKDEIEQTEAKLREIQHLRVPDKQIANSETHLSNLQTKLSDELTKDAVSARKAIDDEIKEVVKQLEENDKSDIKITELKDRLKLLQAKLVDLIVDINNDIVKKLREEITAVTERLSEYQDGRLSDSQISGLETHLTSLRGKLVESLFNNDNDVRRSLIAEINMTIREIDANQRYFHRGNGIVNDCTKVNDAIDAFITSITTVPTGSAYSPLVTACIRENFATEKIRYILKIKLMSSGADFTIKKTGIFERTGNTSYLGGGVVSYVMAEKDGKLAASGTVTDIAVFNHKIGEEPKLYKSREENRLTKLIKKFWRDF